MVLEMSARAQSDDPGQEHEEGLAVDISLEDLYSVILHNDDHNAAEFVVSCLMQVFGHSFELARRIMEEAHVKGCSLAEVESREDADLHSRQLRSFGLTVTMEKTS